jgi:tRNA(Ile2) C34 agmatinyltransferase TiaS
MKRIVFTLILVIILAGIAILFYVYYKPHPTAESQKTALKITASKLYLEFSENEKKANSMYLNKWIEVEGRVSEISKDQEGARTIVLMEESDIAGVVCSIDEELMKDVKIAPVNVGDRIIVKGNCVGYDMDVKLNKCLILGLSKDKQTALK